MGVWVWWRGGGGGGGGVMTVSGRHNDLSLVDSADNKVSSSTSRVGILLIMRVVAAAPIVDTPTWDGG